MPDYEEQGRLDEILRLLELEYPEATTTLKFSSPFELLIAVILSAQTADEQVNKITRRLFRCQR